MSGNKDGIWLTTEQTAQRLGYSFDTFSAFGRDKYLGMKRRCEDGVSELSRGRRQYFSLNQVDRIIELARAAKIRRPDAMRVIAAIDSGLFEA